MSSAVNENHRNFSLLRLFIEQLTSADQQAVILSEHKKGKNLITLVLEAMDFKEQKISHDKNHDLAFETLIFLLESLPANVNKDEYIIGHRMVLQDHYPLMYLMKYYKTTELKYANEQQKKAIRDAIPQKLKAILSLLSSDQARDRAVTQLYSGVNLLKYTMENQNLEIFLILLNTLSTQEVRDEVLIKGLHKNKMDGSLLETAAFFEKELFLKPILDAMSPETRQKSCTTMEGTHGDNLLEVLANHHKFWSLDLILSYKVLDQSHYPFGSMWESFLENYNKIINQKLAHDPYKNAQRDIECCIVFLKHTDNANIRNKRILENEMISYAIDIDRFDFVERLLELLSDNKKEEAIVARGSFGRNALHWAAVVAQNKKEEYLKIKPKDVKIYYEKNISYDAKAARAPYLVEAHPEKNGECFLKFLIKQVKDRKILEEALSEKDDDGKSVFDIYPDIKDILEEKAGLPAKLAELKKQLESLKQKLEALKKGLADLTGALQKAPAVT
ncbi:hypothetical protein JST56_04575 [Candidatus Dependentiae bacterium]|nr:hypothetical protein [Candidatus Dependentiae bacterium]